MTAEASAVNSFAMRMLIECYWGDDMAYQVEYGLGSMRKTADVAPTAKKASTYLVRKVFSYLGVLFLFAAVVFVSLKDRNIVQQLSCKPGFVSTAEQLVNELKAGESVREAFMRFYADLVEYA